MLCMYPLFKLVYRRLIPLYYSMEGLRVYPPVPMTIRQAAKSDFVDGVWVPKGTLFYIAVSTTLLCSEVRPSYVLIFSLRSE